MIIDTVTTSDGKKIKVKINRDLCIGAATCVAIAPKAFALDNQSKATVLKTAGEETEQAIFKAAKACPTAAIILEDEKDK